MEKDDLFIKIEEDTQHITEALQANKSLKSLAVRSNKKLGRPIVKAFTTTSNIQSLTLHVQFILHIFICYSLFGIGYRIKLQISTNSL